MDYMYNACSTTARRGALDWAPLFEKANLPVFEKLYESVKNGTETRKSLEFNGRKTYREDLAKELKEIDEQEIWRAGPYRDSKIAYECSTDMLATHLQARPSARSAPTTSHHKRTAMMDDLFRSSQKK
jgi:ketol-acid reductoisomerase